MFSRILLLALTLLGAPALARAQTEGGTGLRAALDDPLLEEASDRARRGESDLADRKLGRLLDETPEHLPARILRARIRAAMVATAPLEEDLVVLRAAAGSEGATARALAAILDARRLARIGKYEEAIERARAARKGPLDWTALSEEAEILFAADREKEGRAVAEELVGRFGEESERSPRELLAMGRALERADDLRGASELYVGISRAPLDRLDPFLQQDALVALAELYAKVYRNAAGFPNGEKDLNEVLNANPSHAGALLARHRLGRDNWKLDGERTARCLASLLEIDPSHPEALLIQVRGMIDERRFEEAESTLQRVLDQNPRHGSAIAEKVSLDHLTNRREAFEKAMEEDRKRRPDSSRLPRVVGTHLKALYRFADAIPFLEEAARRDARDGDALTALGECLAHTGREKEARERLEQAEEAERGWVHPWRSNMVTVLRVLDEKYVGITTPRFHFRVHPDVRDLLEETLVPFYEDARTDYGERYGYVPEGPVQVEMFQRFDDFSVRTTGFAGFGALGVCFGRLITSVSPTVDQFRRNFSYLDTAWHEYAHVVHLGLSKGRVPRWFTEGLATLEEKKKNPAFDRHMEIELLEARATGQIFPVLQLNGAFRGPRILFGYYQGGLLCEMLEQRTSSRKFVEALELFGKDLPLDQVLERAFGMTGEEIDRAFEAFVDAKLASVRVRPALDEPTIRRLRTAIAKDPRDAESLRALAWAYARRERIVMAEQMLEKLREVAPDDGDAWLVRASLSLARNRPDLALEQFEQGFAKGGEDFFARLQHAALLEKNRSFVEMKGALRAAIAAFPGFADEARSPHLALAKHLAAEGDVEGSVALLEQFCRINGTARAPRLALADRYEGAGDLARLAHVLEELLDVEPVDRATQQRLARACLALGRFVDAARAGRRSAIVPVELQVAGKDEKLPERDSSEDREERAEGFALEAEGWLGAGDAAAAGSALERARALDPGNERAADVERRLPERSGR